MKLIIDTLQEISKNFIDLSDSCSSDIHIAADIIIDSLSSGGKVMFCGNGGSAADSQHLSAELVGRYIKDRKPLASVALTTDTSIITAVSNDFSFDNIFSRQIESIGNENDVLYAISTSGKSKNIITALEKARFMKIKTIGVTGNNNNDEIIDLCDVIIKAPGKRSDRIQEMHIAIGHVICEIVEKQLC
jgi:D-sedoheptulose 7-phosphate isomerase